MSKDNLVELYPNVVECSECETQCWIVHTKPGSTNDNIVISFLECAECEKHIELGVPTSDLQITFEPDESWGTEET